MIVILASMACPVAFFALGAWLERIGTVTHWSDELVSRWPFTALGAGLGAVMVIYA
jgi:hypothetical protein